MVLLNQKWDKLLELVFENPNQAFTVRDISKKTRIPASSVHRHLKKLRKAGLLTSENKSIITPYLKFAKSSFFIDRMFKSGLIDFLDKELNPSAIILFGGVRKGEYDNESDIDLFIESTRKKQLDLSVFEKKLGHKIQLFVEKDINDLQSNLRNNVVNGIKLSGYFKIK